MRDIEDNNDFKYRNKQIYPIKTGGVIDICREFMHLTTHRVTVEENGNSFQRNEFEMARSRRLHWINHHVHELSPENIEVFSVTERDQKKRNMRLFIPLQLYLPTSFDIVAA